MEREEGRKEDRQLHKKTERPKKRKVVSKKRPIVFFFFSLQLHSQFHIIFSRSVPPSGEREVT